MAITILGHGYSCFIDDENYLWKERNEPTGTHQDSDRLTPKSVCSFTKLSTSQGPSFVGIQISWFTEHLVQWCLNYLLSLTFRHSQLLSSSHRDPRGAGWTHEDGTCFGTEWPQVHIPVGTVSTPLLEQPGFRFWPLLGSTLCFSMTKKSPGAWNCLPS